MGTGRNRFGNINSSSSSNDYRRGHTSKNNNFQRHQQHRKDRFHDSSRMERDRDAKNDDDRDREKYDSLRDDRHRYTGDGYHPDLHGSHRVPRRQVPSERGSKHYRSTDNDDNSYRPSQSRHGSIRSGEYLRRDEFSYRSGRNRRYETEDNSASSWSDSSQSANEDRHRRGNRDISRRSSSSSS